MTSEITNPNGNGDGSPSGYRKPEEIQARMKELEMKINGHDVWIPSGLYSSVPDPDSKQKQDVFRAKLNELKWILGEEKGVTDLY